LASNIGYTFALTVLS